MPVFQADVSHQLQENRGGHSVVHALSTQGPITRIKELFNKVELSVSSYDTAWVAMVPSQDSLDQPCFPECLNWIMENQHPDGSWGLHPSHPLLVKDSISSTLACLLALQKWKVGDLLVKRGLDFIDSYGLAAFDKHQYTPIGFDIIFPGMIDYAREMALNLPLDSVLVDRMLHRRDMEVESLKGKKIHLGYVAEGLCDLIDWKEVMENQRSNGSLFNSPSTTAAALIHLHDDKCLEYLCSILKRYGNAVPTTYPLDMYTRLSMVDSLTKLGIDEYFKNEIGSTLSDAYKCWIERDEEILLDVAGRAMGFRLLHALAEFSEKDSFFSTVSAQFKDTKTILELYRASQITIFQNEPVLEKLHAWTTSYLTQELLSGAILDKRLYEEVNYALKYPQASLERIESRTCIEHYDEDNIRLLKTSYRCSNIDNRDLLAFSLQDFNMCQAIHRKELEHLERWVKDYRLDQLKFARQRITYAYFTIASVLSHSDFSDARISWSKNTVLVTTVDDLYDSGGSMEEILNLIELVEKWDEHSTVGYCSEQVKILFSAIYDTINDLAAKAYIQHERSVKSHFIEIWLRLLEGDLREVEWMRNNLMPTVDDYMSIGTATIALEPVVVISLYFLGSKLSEEVVASAEYKNLYKHTGIIGRLLNDLVGVEREGAQGKLNSLSLRVIHAHGAISEEEAKREMTKLIESHRRELLRMVLQTKGSVVPQVCKDLFWKTSKIVHLSYMGIDMFTCPRAMLSVVKEIIHEPIVLHFD